MEIFEDSNTGAVHIDKKIVYGFISDKTCPQCGHKQVYYEKYDAFFCPKEDIWLEKGCSDPKCEYCGKRPSRPISD